MSNKFTSAGGSAYDKLLGILTYKDYSSREVYDKLTQKGFSERESAAAVARAVGNGLIDDEKYAVAVAERKMHFFGRRNVAFELKKRGISDEISEQVMLRLYEDADAPADILPEMMKKFRGRDICDPKVRASVFGFFARRGYEFEDIRKAYELCRDEYENK